MSLPRAPPTGIKILIVGAGFAGLCAALEAHRKGHTPILLERVAHLKPLGDIISFGQNATRIFARWPGILETFDPIIHKANAITYHHWQGEAVTTQSFEREAIWGKRVNGHRAELHRVLYEYALANGIDVRLGVEITDYFEDDDKASVVTATGERLTADLVLAAEGVKSAGRKIVLGFEDAPKPSGYAVYRAWFTTEQLKNNPLTQQLVQGDTHNGWIGQDIHFLVASIKDGEEISWVCTHKDDAGIEESWQFPGKVDDVLKVLEGWAPTVRELVNATPEARLFDYKLVFRDPLPTFISPLARIALIGDAAHPFLPTSIQGASQAMEDGVVLAACLDAAGGGKDNVQEAVRVWERIRYERVHAIQATGVSTREKWHKADWDAIWRDPKSLHLKREEWILKFDAEEEAYKAYARVRDELGKKQEARNGLNGEAVAQSVVG